MMTDKPRGVAGRTASVLPILKMTTKDTPYVLGLEQHP